MDFVRVVTNSDLLKDVVNLPESLLHQQVEVIILPLSNQSYAENIGSQISNVGGSLRAYANDLLREKEADAWGESVEDKS